MVGVQIDHVPNCHSVSWLRLGYSDDDDDDYDDGGGGDDDDYYYGEFVSLHSSFMHRLQDGRKSGTTTSH